MKNIDSIPLKTKDRCAIREAVKAISARFPLKKAVLFGSKARGTDEASSDLDILLVCTRKLSWREERDVIDILFDIGLEHDVLFSPLFASSDEWDGGLFAAFPIQSEIIEQGAAIL